MYGLITKLTAAAGRRDELIAILSAEVGPMPGCWSYLVARDRSDPDALWVTEVWQDHERHQASLASEHVRATIADARPLIATVGPQYETDPVYSAVAGLDARRPRRKSRSANSRRPG